MSLLPMLPASCSLDEAGLSAQLARYRAVGEGARIIDRDRRRVVLRLSELVPDDLIQELVAVERGCCPFFVLDWRPRERRLLVAVSAIDEEPALEASAYALGLGEATPIDSGSGLGQARATGRP
jgi:hypothetical protein